MLDLLYNDFSSQKISIIIKNNFNEISFYKEEIEKINDDYFELTRHSSEKIYETLSHL